jgi:hypothetical protein
MSGTSFWDSNAATWLFFACVFLIIPALSGCSYGDEGARTVSLSPQDERWADEANAICAEARKEVEALPAPKSETQEKIEYERLNAIGARMVVRLRQLKPTPDNVDEVRAMTNAYAAVNDVLARMARATYRQQFDVVFDLGERASRLGSRGDRLALKLGADECAREAFDDTSDADA